MFGYNYSNGSQTTKTKSDNGTVNEIIESTIPSIVKIIGFKLMNFFFNW